MKNRANIIDEFPITPFFVIVVQRICNLCSVGIAGIAVVYGWGQPIARWRYAWHQPLAGNTRRAVMVLLVAWLTGFGSLMLALFLAYKYQHHVHPGLLGDREMREHPSIGWVSLGLLMITGWMITTACSRMHHWLRRDKQLNFSTPQKTCKAHNRSNH